MQSEIKWVCDVLGETVLKTETIVEVIYSTVSKITTESGVYFLKTVPENYFIEADILERLQGHTVTPFIAKNDDLKCFLTKACGDKTLRQYFYDNDKAEIDLMKRALSHYYNIQKSTTNDLDFYLQKGVPDWRWQNFLALYSEIIRNDYFMDLWDKERVLQPELIARENALAELCEQLASYDLLDTLNHCDLHNNNIIINEETKNLTIIDWAETSISQPVLSIEPFFRSLRKHHGMKRTDKKYIALQNYYLSQWGVAADEVRPLLNILGNIYFVFCMRNVILMTGNTFEKWAGDVTAALEDFCSLSSGT